ncbi:hypothetical protein NHX12_027774 [Muraenolepis orangiensis]|uniref:Uncharacterized protein n=1 Tax=Muraenolepis orangiensis TaxID=630683 RepID=A0A9Q0EED7_9TELE|nr:hypothetical protein NHX12_027774 [Muraenolepis orangiensis]
MDSFIACLLRMTRWLFAPTALDEHDSTAEACDSDYRSETSSSPQPGRYRTTAQPNCPNQYPAKPARALQNQHKVQKQQQQQQQQQPGLRDPGDPGDPGDPREPCADSVRSFDMEQRGIRSDTRCL